jgi:hypothetical protein
LQHVKKSLWFTGVGITAKIDQPFLARFHPLLTEVSHVAWRGTPLEMTDGTKGGAHRARSLRPRCFGVVDPETATRIYPSNHSPRDIESHPRSESTVLMSLFTVCFSLVTDCIILA